MVFEKKLPVGKAGDPATLCVANMGHACSDPWSILSVIFFVQDGQYYTLDTETEKLHNLPANTLSPICIETVSTAE
jgi:hypothetical protein